MTLKECAARLNLETLNAGVEGKLVAAGYTSDLLSDVMSHASADSLLITIQAHKNTIAVASLVGIVGIIVCNGRQAPPDMLEAARAEKIAVFRTTENQFTISGRLYGLIEAEIDNRTN